MTINNKDKLAKQFGAGAGMLGSVVVDIPRMAVTPTGDIIILGEPKRKSAGQTPLSVKSPSGGKITIKRHYNG